MLLRLINPDNPVVSITKLGLSRLNKYRTWKPLSLLVLARITPASWTLDVIDENLGPVDHARLPRPDLVGVTAFTSQAPRAYEIARQFRAVGVPVVMGGIHATMRVAEALEHVDAVVTGEAESVWAQVLADVEAGRLQRVYHGGLGPATGIPPARHDLLAGRYYLGAIQTTRGCPLSCTFCSVTAFNGGQFRHRPIGAVIDELREIRERKVLFVDDNLIGTRHDHVERSKALFRAMIAAGLTRPWICQATVNFADDEEQLALAAAAGCEGVLIGFESATPEGLVAVHKKFNLKGNRDLPASVRRIQRHGIQVVGSFIMGLDTDQPGIGRLIAEAADRYGLDMATVLVLTPLPGTALYAEMEREGRIVAGRFPDDWQYYTLGYPVARYRHFTWRELEDEMADFARRFYSIRKIAGRSWRIGVRTRSPRKVGVGTVMNLTQRWGHRFHERTGADRTRLAPAEAGGPGARARPVAASTGVAPLG
jgi:radical SAM superfamily enzyme YgiQ (UPF0313 family)